MLVANLYQPIFLFLITIITLIYYSRYNSRNGILTYPPSVSEEAKTLLLAVFMTWFIGFRPESGKFVDMMNYVQSYYVFFDGTPFSWNWGTENILFDNYFAWVGSMRLGTTFFFLTISAIYFLTAFVACKRLFPKDMLVAYLVFLAAFSTFSYGTNGIKAGAAGSLFLMAIAYRQNLKICILLLLISWGFHHSMQLPIVVVLLTIFFKNPKWYFLGWLFCLLMAIAHVTIFQEMLGRITDDQGARYLLHTDEEWGGKAGFRIDFVLYSAMPILVGYYAIYKKKIQPSLLYICLLNTYLCTNGIWMLSMYANFTNRIAYLSWILYPIILIYPFLNENWGGSRYKTFAKVMLAHLTFTLFMQGVYYGNIL